MTMKWIVLDVVRGKQNELSKEMSLQDSTVTIIDRIEGKYLMWYGHMKRMEDHTVYDQKLCLDSTRKEKKTNNKEIVARASAVRHGKKKTARRSNDAWQE